MFEPVSSRVNFPQNEEKQLAFWKQNQIFEKSVKNREGRPRFVLYEGPPTANGNPGIHHVLARAYKDIITRYKVMKGYYAPRIAGWDTHGLPVELEVEKQLGFSGKSQIEAYGVQQFNEKCRDSVFKYLKEWDNLTERIAYWVDLENAYVTMNSTYIESVWWAIRQMWDKGLIYQGYKVTPHCPRCGTSLSSHEVALGYQDNTEDPSIFIKFRTHLKSKQESPALAHLRELSGRKKVYLMAWTTTPWTLPGNTAVAVAADIEYAVVENEGEYLIFADARKQALGLEENTVIAKIPGKELVGVEYEPLFNPHEFGVDRERFTSGNELKLQRPLKSLVYHVIAANFVSMEDGTGIVHIAPAYGEDDYQAGQENGLDFVHNVDLQGKIIGSYPFAGKFIKTADPLVLDYLRERGHLFKVGTIKHTYPFCWRCSSPLVYYAKQSWYIRTTAVKEELVKGNEEINWYPEHVKEGRFGDWLAHNVDWAFSRERYWGTPLPIWKCEKCGSFECIGSVDELKGKTGVKMDSMVAHKLKSGEYDLHRPFIDDTTFACGKCGGQMKRAPEVIDCWFDSGSMPFAQLHYPFENKELFDKDLKRADYICEGVDQTRGWFYSLHAISTLLFDRPCYKNCICLELVLDAKGEKMSKSKGNVVKPMDVVKLHGADALRWYCYTSAPPGSVRRFDTKMVADITRSVMLTLWNVYSFFVMYANIDNYKYDPVKIVTEVPELDLWILSELNQLITDVDSSLENYNPTGAARKIEEFVDMLSNWYVRRSRRRFWKSESDTDKLSAYNTLYLCLVTVSKLIAPFMPYLAEEMYQNLVRSQDKDAPVSVHLADFPVADTSKINRQLSEATELVIEVCSVGRAARSKTGIKVRQPVDRAIIGVTGSDKENDLLRLKPQILEELNVKDIVIKKMTEVDELSRNLYEVAGIEQKRKEDDFEKKGLSPLFGVCLVGIPRTVSPELAEEGLAREIVHRLQTMRKTAGFEIADYIVTYYQGDDYVKQVMNNYADYVKLETLSRSLIDGKPEEGVATETFKLNDHAVVLAVKKI